MKSKLVIFLVLFISTIVYSQTKKNHFLIGGSSNLSLMFVSSESYTSGSDKTYKSSYTFLNFSPIAGYFISDDLAIGLLLGYSGNFRDNSNTSSYYAGPFARYYFSKSEKLLPFAQTAMTYGTSSRYTSGLLEGSPYSVNSTIFGYELDLGLSFLLSKRVSLDVMAGYSYTKKTTPIKNVYCGNETSNSNTYHYYKKGMLGISFGISVFLGKN